MPAAGELTALGFLFTPRFECSLGSGADAAARVRFEFQDGRSWLRFSPLTSNANAKARVRLLTARQSGELWVDEVKRGPWDSATEIAATIASEIEVRSAD